MALPDPKPGLVIRYDYLWADQAGRGDEHGKDRPACIVAATDNSAKPRFVVLLPITHSPPQHATLAIEIPDAVRRSIGLDEARSWIVLSEHNVDEWPNPGIARVSNSADGFSYGFVPPRLFAQIKQAFLKAASQRRSSTVRR